MADYLELRKRRPGFFDRLREAERYDFASIRVLLDLAAVTKHVVHDDTEMHGRISIEKTWQRPRFSGSFEASNAAPSSPNKGMSDARATRSSCIS